MVRHYHKLMQSIFLFLAVVKKDIHHQTSHSVGLKDAVLLECGGGDEPYPVFPRRGAAMEGTSAAEAAGTFATVSQR
jgi:hypothetical protein